MGQRSKVRRTLPSSLIALVLTISSFTPTPVTSDGIFSWFRTKPPEPEDFPGPTMLRFNQDFPLIQGLQSGRPMRDIKTSSDFPELNQDCVVNKNSICVDKYYPNIASLCLESPFESEEDDLPPKYSETPDPGSGSDEEDESEENGSEEDESEEDKKKPSVKKPAAQGQGQTGSTVTPTATPAPRSPAKKSRRKRAATKNAKKRKKDSDSMSGSGSASDESSEATTKTTKSIPTTDLKQPASTILKKGPKNDDPPPPYRLPGFTEFVGRTRVECDRIPFLFFWSHRTYRPICCRPVIMKLSPDSSTQVPIWPNEINLHRFLALVEEEEQTGKNATTIKAAKAKVADPIAESNRRLTDLVTIRNDTHRKLEASTISVKEHQSIVNQLKLNLATPQVPPLGLTAEQHQIKMIAALSAAETVLSKKEAEANALNIKYWEAALDVAKENLVNKELVDKVTPDSEPARKQASKFDLDQAKKFVDTSTSILANARTPVKSVSSSAASTPTSTNNSEKEKGFFSKIHVPWGKKDKDPNDSGTSTSSTTSLASTGVPIAPTSATPAATGASKEPPKPKGDPNPKSEADEYLNKMLK